MNWDLYFIDGLALALLVIVIYKGFRRGLLNQVAWLGSLVLGYFAGVWFSDNLAELVGIRLFNERFTILVAFVAIFCGVVVLATLLAKWLTRILNLTPIGFGNAILGGLANGLIYVIVLLVVVNLGMISIPKLDQYLEKTLTLKPLVAVEKCVMDSKTAKKVFEAVNDIGE